MSVTGITAGSSLRPRQAHDHNGCPQPVPVESHLTAAKGKMRVAYADPGCEFLEGIAMHQIRGDEHGGRASNAGQAVRDHGFVQLPER